VSEAVRVALTFDAEHPDRPWCPPGNVHRIVGVLDGADVRATFFVQGRWAKAHPDVAARIAADGHLIGNNSHYHARMRLFSDDGLRADLADAADAVTEATGQDPRPWFRCPFGDGHDDPRVLGILDELGYRNVHWHVEAEDWEPWRTGPAIAEDVVAGVRAPGDGAVVLLHTWPGGTGDAIEPCVAALRGDGARLVGVDELEALP
jgi:peptidoglycan/xylan/chitin deacetylase (PgdA/CDA1 family)